MEMKKKMEPNNQDTEGETRQENVWEKLEEETPMLAMKEYFEATSPTKEQIMEHNRRQQEEHKNILVKMLYV